MSARVCKQQMWHIRVDGHERSLERSHAHIWIAQVHRAVLNHRDNFRLSDPDGRTNFRSVHATAAPRCEGKQH